MQHFMYSLDGIRYNYSLLLSYSTFIVITSNNSMIYVISCSGPNNTDRQWPAIRHNIAAEWRCLGALEAHCCRLGDTGN